MKKILILLMVQIALFGFSAEEAAKKSFEAISGYKSSISTTTMILKNAQGDINERKLEMRRLEGEDGDRSLLIFLYPNDLKGTKLLSYEVIGGDDKQWLYLPSLKRVKRISSRNKSGSFMASEFSYEDIASQNYKNYRYDTDVIEVKKDMRTFLQITRYPKDKNSGYSKQVIYLDPRSFLMVFGEFYDKRGKLLKKMSFSDYQQLQGIYRVHKIEIYNVQNNKTSILIWDTDKIKAGLTKRDFSKRVLR